MKQISNDDLSALAQAAHASPRKRANLNLHDTLPDPIQRLAIAMEPATLVRPHRHPHTWELLYPLQGRFIVLHFDDAGVVTDRAVLGEGTAVLETPAGQWHAVLSLDSGGVIFEVKHGPYTPIADADFAMWAPSEDEAQIADLLRWYATAQIGDCFPK
ncbi:WbuC family cupin fold metalloprotein [Chitinibacter bivalviorum]|uniref:WbuC family cupin fold metalloprotein n=1 Tax=Chitinibacter bivalviorum TaxID=2739434 RepID=A0A7H9BLA7_9NEIS|nr:WbuC family cupin fold metalloprotein [Chitinibacter bivalviorum]QLG89172.1 WbuC family cupin fold metalloprotein [Chitinibacter bivalviorum]